MKEVTLFTDGSCLGNPGPGAWACVLRYGKHERILRGVALRDHEQLEGVNYCK